jgi:TolB-like protein
MRLSVSDCVAWAFRPLHSVGETPMLWELAFMRHLFTAAIVLALVSIARAEPATQPSCDVFVTPFTALGGDNSLDWAGKAVSQNLLTDLAQAKFHPLEADKALPTTADAQAAARAAGAKFLIAGTYQTVQLQVRFTGQILDVASGNVIGGMSATGSPRDLFSLEDSLSTQAISQLNPTSVAQAAMARNKTAAQAAAPAPAAAAPVIVQIVQAAPANPGVAYQGSALQGYVDSNRNPSSDLPQQPPENNDTPYPYNYPDAGAYGFGQNGYGGYGYGTFGYGFGSGFSIYSVSPGSSNGTRSGQGNGDHHTRGQNHDRNQQP